MWMGGTMAPVAASPAPAACAAIVSGLALRTLPRAGRECALTLPAPPSRPSPFGRVVVDGIWFARRVVTDCSGSATHGSKYAVGCGTVTVLTLLCSRVPPERGF